MASSAPSSSKRKADDEADQNSSSMQILDVPLQVGSTVAKARASFSSIAAICGVGMQKLASGEIHDVDEAEVLFEDILATASSAITRIKSLQQARGPCSADARIGMPGNAMKLTGDLNRRGDNTALQKKEARHNDERHKRVRYDDAEDHSTMQPQQTTVNGTTTAPHIINSASAIAGTSLRGSAMNVARKTEAPSMLLHTTVKLASNTPCIVLDESSDDETEYPKTLLRKSKASRSHPTSTSTTSSTTALVNREIAEESKSSKEICAVSTNGDSKSVRSKAGIAVNSTPESATKRDRKSSSQLAMQTSTREPLSAAFDHAQIQQNIANLNRVCKASSDKACEKLFLDRLARCVIRDQTFQAQISKSATGSWDYCWARWKICESLENANISYDYKAIVNGQTHDKRASFKVLTDYLKCFDPKIRKAIGAGVQELADIVDDDHSHGDLHDTATRMANGCTSGWFEMSDAEAFDCTSDIRVRRARSATRVDGYKGSLRRKLVLAWVEAHKVDRV